MRPRTASERIAARKRAETTEQLRLEVERDRNKNKPAWDWPYHRERFEDLDFTS